MSTDVDTTPLDGSLDGTSRDGSAPDRSSLDGSLDVMWGELLATALLGTDRRPLPAAPPTGPAAGFGTGGHPALALLDRAAAVHAMRRAGALPLPPDERGEPCPHDPRRPCPSPAAHRLAALVGGRHPELLTEWLATLAARDLLLPPEHLGALMERSRSDPDLRRRVLASAGPIVRWVGGQVPGLGWAVPAGPDEGATWEHGSFPERLEVLRRLRASDPAAGRALLAAGLGGERAERRAAFLGALAVGLGEEDEELLERALDDRTAGVRHVAAGLLAELTTSAWAQRAARRGLGLVRVVESEGQDRLDVVLVAPAPPEWERDGITASAPTGGSLGVHILRQVVAAAPLRTWSALGSVSHLAVLAAEHELGPVLLAAWAEAAGREADPEWARVLLDETGEPALVPALTVADRRRAALRAVSADAVLTPFALALLEGLPLPWSDDVRTAVGRAFVALFAERRAGRHHGPLLSRLARALDPALLASLSGALGALGLPPPVDGVRDDLVELLAFRAAMLDELTAQEAS